MSISSLCGHTRAKTSRSSKVAISQSSSLENWGKVHFMSLAIALSSLTSLLSSVLVEEDECARDWREGVGDGDLDFGLMFLGVILGMLVGPAVLWGTCVDSAAGLTDFIGRLVLRLRYFDTWFRVRPCDGRFQYVWSPKSLSSFFMLLVLWCCSWWFLCFDDSYWRFLRVNDDSYAFLFVLCLFLFRILVQGCYCISCLTISLSSVVAAVSGSQSGLLLPAVTSLLCRESRESHNSIQVQEREGSDQSLVLRSRSPRNQTTTKKMSQMFRDRKSA